MSEQPAPNPSDPPPAGTAPSWEDSFKGEDPAKVRKALDHAREWEKRAKDNATAATELAKIQDAQKTETERSADRVAKAEAEAATVPAKVADALRSHLVAIHKIAPERAELYLTATDPDLLIKQVAGLVDIDSTKPRNVVPREGNTSQPKDDEMRVFAQQLFKKAD